MAWIEVSRSLVARGRSHDVRTWIFGRGNPDDRAVFVGGVAQSPRLAHCRNGAPELSAWSLVAMAGGMRDGESADLTKDSPATVKAGGGSRAGEGAVGRPLIKRDYEGAYAYLQPVVARSDVPVQRFRRSIAAIEYRAVSSTRSSA